MALAPVLPRDQDEGGSIMYWKHTNHSELYDHFLEQRLSVDEIWSIMRHVTEYDRRMQVDGLFAALGSDSFRLEDAAELSPRLSSMSPRP